MPELYDALRTLWDERHPRRPGWIRHLHVKHVVRILMYNVVVLHSDAVRMKEHGLVPGDGTRLRTILDNGGWDDVQRLSEHASAYAAAAKDHFRALPADRRPSGLIPERISEKACTDVGAAHRRRRLETTEAEFVVGVTAARGRFQAVETERAPRKRALLTEDEFAARYADRHDAAWEARDRAAHAVDAPWRGALGRLPRPPLIGPSCDWHAGTDRPVYRRYLHFRSPRAAAKRAGRAEQMGLPEERHMSVRLLDLDPDGPARGEVDRATEPLGLRHVAHRTLLRAVHDAILAADLESAAWERGAAGRRRRPLEQWCSTRTRLPDALDPDLGTALAAACASASARYGSVLALAAQDARLRPRRDADGEEVDVELPEPDDADPVRDTGDDAGGRAMWPEQVELGVLRRLWLELLKCELEWDAALTPARLPALLGAMFGRHLGELARRPMQRYGADTRSALERTLRALGPHFEAIARDALADRPEWRERYAGLLRHATDGPFLDAGAFRSWILDNLGIPDRGEPDHPDDPDDLDDGGA